MEGWCWELVTTRELERKLAPRPVPGGPAADKLPVRDEMDSRQWEESPPTRRLLAPGRPPELERIERAPRAPRSAALTNSRARAHLVHTFLHHELQAAELFAWAILAFPGTPRGFRAGCLRLCQEELQHLALYREHLARLGFAVGAFPVRDWFWERVGAVPDALAFVALLGLGLEGANLEHSARFAAEFRAVGDKAGAGILERIEREEIAHVAFARRWFELWTGAPLDYERWRAALPAPLTPALFRGRPLNRRARTRAGFDQAFLARLEAEPATTARGET